MSNLASHGFFWSRSARLPLHSVADHDLVSKIAGDRMENHSCLCSNTSSSVFRLHLYSWLIWEAPKCHLRALCRIWSLLYMMYTVKCSFSLSLLLSSLPFLPHPGVPVASYDIPPTALYAMLHTALCSIAYRGPQEYVRAHYPLCAKVKPGWIELKLGVLIPGWLSIPSMASGLQCQLPNLKSARNVGAL